MRKILPIALSLAALLGGCASNAETSADAMKAVFAAGLKDYDAGNFEAAYKKWSSIDDEDLAAMRNVGIMLRTGKGVPKNPGAAEAMLERAADAGLFTAQADLGEMLLNGEAGPPDPKAAAPWLALAAAAGHPMAQFELGQLYEQGTAIPKNLEAARTLYTAAAAGGVADAAKRLAALPAPATPPAIRH